MPHKVTTTGLVDELTTTAKVAGACNAILPGPAGAGRRHVRRRRFVRGVLRKGRRWPAPGPSLSAAAASVCHRGFIRHGGPGGHRACSTPMRQTMNGLAERLRAHYPALEDRCRIQGSCGFRCRRQRDAPEHEAGDPLPMDVARIAPGYVRRRSRDEAGNHPVLAAAMERVAAKSRSAPTCCSSRSRPTRILRFRTTTPDELQGRRADQLLNGPVT